METVVRRPTDVEINLLTTWGEPGDGRRGRQAGALSILIHIAVIGGLLLVPKGLLEPPRREVVVTPLIAPPDQLTQTEPNKGKISKEFNTTASLPRPRIQIPAAKDQTPPPPRPTVMPPIPEPPKLQANAAIRTLLPPLPQPQIEPVEKPAPVFENPTAASGPEPGQGLPLPKATAADAIRGALRSRPGGIGQGLDIPGATGMQPNNMELLSDPMGVDFRPYLAQVLLAVKRYWMAVWPESARMGRSGKVALQFSIDRGGLVPKLVIASSSGDNSLDRAAVAAISGSVPFAPLPRDFRGDVIKLQLNFAYNMPK